MDEKVNLSLVKDELSETMDVPLHYIKVENDNFVDYKTSFKQEVADLNFIEPSANEYDDSFVICKEELRIDSLEMMQQTSTESQVSADSKQAIRSIDILLPTTEDKQKNTSSLKTEDDGSDGTDINKNNKPTFKLRVMNEIVSSEEKTETLGHRLLKGKRNTIIGDFENVAHSNRKPFSCNDCSYKCDREDHLVNHIRSHTGEKPFSCNICNYGFPIMSHLISHMKTHTGEKPFSCTLCNFKCTNNSTLNRHMYTHTSDKPFSCKLCSFKSRDKGYLTVHARIHSGDKPFSCKLCSYKCRRNSHLIIHMRTHTGEKPFSCTHCSYKSVTKSHLVSHMKIHTGEKPFSCKFCNYKCRSNSILIIHYRTHTGEKPFLCKLCSYKCNHSSSLRRHVQDLH